MSISPYNYKTKIFTVLDDQNENGKQNKRCVPISNIFNNVIPTIIK